MRRERRKSSNRDDDINSKIMNLIKTKTYENGEVRTEVEVRTVKPIIKKETLTNPSFFSSSSFSCSLYVPTLIITSQLPG